MRRMPANPYLRFLRAVFLGLLLAGAGRAEAATSASSDYRASIVRTGYGVPHVTAADWGSLGYGYGYVIAVDNLCTMADGFVTVRGERSKFFGPDAKPIGISTLEEARNEDSDFFFRFIVNDGMVKRMADAQGADLRALVAGYAAGYARYVAEIKAGQHEGRHQACRAADWVRPISAEDLYRRFYTSNLARSEARMLNAIATAAPPKNGVTKQGAADVAPPIDPTRIGSNALAFGADATGGTSGLLFGNPHWMWVGMDRFYQAHLRIPGKLDVQGVSISGIPLISIGFNQNVAWTHTVSSAQRHTIYQLDLSKDDPTAYVYDGQVHKLEAVPVSIEVRQPDGSVVARTRTLYRSLFGPMLAKDWTTEHALTVRTANAENFRQIENWLQWNQAKTLTQFIEIQKKLVGIPWVNTLAVGRDDPRAWYADISVVPDLPDETWKACAINPQTLDGTRSACAWRTDPDSPQSGIFGISHLPTIERRDYVANMNDSYWLANPAAPSTGYPRIIGSTTDPVTARTRMGLRLVADRLAGKDGLGSGKVTSESVRRMVLDARNLTAELYLDAVLQGPCASPDPAIAPACSALAAWDRRSELDSVGAPVWDVFWAQLEKTVPPARLYRTKFDPQDPVNTPRDLNVADPGIVEALAFTVKTLAGLGFRLDTKLRDYQFVQDAAGKHIPLSGGCVSSGYFSAVCTRPGPTGMTLLPAGNSYLQVVQFDRAGPQAWTLLLSSQSTDPASPWFRAGTADYAQKAWTRMPTTPEQIAKASVEKLELSGPRR